MTNEQSFCLDVPKEKKELQLMSLKYNYSGLVERPWLLRILPDCPLGKCMYLDHQDWRFWDWELSFPWQWLDWVEYLHFAWSIEVPALASPPPRKPNQFRRLPRRWHSPVLWSHKVWLEKRNWRKFFSVLALISTKISSFQKLISRDNLIGNSPEYSKKRWFKVLASGFIIFVIFMMTNESFLCLSSHNKVWNIKQAAAF